MLLKKHPKLKNQQGKTSSVYRVHGIVFSGYQEEDRVLDFRVIID